MGSISRSVLLVCLLAAESLQNYFPETTSDLIRKEGYTAEEHLVHTTDGYLIKLHRIPGKGPPVLFLHGLFGTSADWVLLPRDKSLGFLVSSAGYDVWLANTRGNTYCRNNTIHSQFQRIFWKFSFTEIGTQDMPQVVDYIQSLTGRRQLAFIGHTLGVSAFFAGASIRQDYATTFTVAIALSPLVFCQHMRSPLRHFSTFIRGIEETVEQDLEIMGGDEFNPRPLIMAAWTTLGCQGLVLQFNLCKQLRYLVGGINPYITNMSRMLLFEGHMSAVSSRTIIHYLQLLKSGTFVPYNEGVQMNLVHYMREKPPPFPLEKISTPVALIWSDYDLLADRLSVLQLKGVLTNVVSDFRVPHSSFGSNDFLLSDKAHELVYPHILDLLDAHT